MVSLAGSMPSINMSRYVHKYIYIYIHVCVVPLAGSMPSINMCRYVHKYIYLFVGYQYRYILAWGSRS